MYRQNVEVTGRAGVVHRLQIVQVVHAPFAAGRVQRWGERARQDLHSRRGLFHHGVHHLQHLHIAGRVDRAKPPLQAQIGLVPNNEVAHSALVATCEFSRVQSERLVALLRQVEVMRLLRTRPLGHKAQARDHSKALSVGVIDHQVRMTPREVAASRLVVGPGKVFYNPGRAHLAHHFKAALDLGRFRLVGQAGMHAHLGVYCCDDSLWAKRDPVVEIGAIAEAEDAAHKQRADQLPHAR